MEAWPRLSRRYPEQYSPRLRRTIVAATPGPRARRAEAIGAPHEVAHPIRPVSVVELFSKRPCWSLLLTYNEPATLSATYSTISGVSSAYMGSDKICPA